MAGKKERRLRALQGKGLSRAAAHNALRMNGGSNYAAKPAEQHGSSPLDDTSQLITALRTVHTSAILVRRLPRVGGSADLQIARAQAEGPDRFVAESGQETRRISRMISADEYRALLVAGATERDGVQVVRVFATEQGTTFSFPCASCGRWTWCGREPRAASCCCGQRYEVRFDLPASWTDWKLPMGQRCADCGKESRMREWVGRREAWGLLGSPWQIQCQPCREFREIGVVPYRKGAEPNDPEELLAQHFGAISWAVEESERTGVAASEIAVLVVDMASAWEGEHAIVEKYAARSFGDVATAAVAREDLRATLASAGGVQDRTIERLKATPPEGFVHVVTISRRFRGIMVSYAPIVRKAAIEA